MIPAAGDRAAIAGAAATWFGAVVGWHRAWPLVIAAAVALLVTRRRLAVVLLVLVAAGYLSGALAAERREAVLTAEVPEGPVRLVVDVVDDRQQGVPALLVVDPIAMAVAGEWQPWAGPPLAMAAPEGAPLPVGTRLEVTGTLRADARLVRGDPVAGTIAGSRIRAVADVAGPLLAAGNLVRSRVHEVVGSSSDARALLAGFLIGDVGGVDPADLGALRRSGLAHFVAVSGANVAFFLGGLWLCLGPLRLGARGRAATGLAAIAVFAVATRWEPSVLRASTAAGLLLAGRGLGLPLRPWVALSGAMVLLLAISGQLAVDVGFQLSVVATAGVLVGVHLFPGRRPAWLWGGLGATVGAQVAVTPLLLAHFGTVPLLSPLANLAAGPLVTAATALGACAVVVGSGFLASLAALIAGVVLAIARAAAEWPQLTAGGVLIAVAVAAVARVRRLRPLVALGVVACLAVPVLRPHAPPLAPTVTFLDVGQGDATLVEDPSGLVMLVDGGPDPGRLHGELRDRGIRRIDLLVVTHGDLDHVGGLAGITSTVGVGTLWIPDHPDLGPVLEQLVAEAAAAGVGVVTPGPGQSTSLGVIAITVVGPLRRYQAQNDGSIVLWVEAGRSVLLPGDVEAVAQAELPDLDPDILLVPHHGAGTTDPDWLRRTVGEVAVVSVGENTYGHPTPEVMAILDASGADVHVTREKGDVVVPLG